MKNTYLDSLTTFLWEEKVQAHLMEIAPWSFGYYCSTYLSTISDVAAMLHRPRCTLTSFRVGS